MRTFVGLDCGGSTSRLLAIDETGEALFRGQGGAANLLATAPETIERNLRRASEGCPRAFAVCGAFAGLVGPAERGRANALLQAIFSGARVRAEPDYAAAHAAAPAGTDVTVIAGTGSLVCGPDRTGRLVKTGVGGYLLGDEGSGYRYGRAALAYYLSRPERRTPNLRAAVAQEFPAMSDPEIVASLHQAPAPQTRLARLLAGFAKDLDAQEPYARAIAEREAGDLAETVALHATTHLEDARRLRIALAGGVWKASDRFRDVFRASIETRLPNSEIDLVKVVRPPVEGAVALAKESMNGNGE